MNFCAKVALSICTDKHFASFCISKRKKYPFFIVHMASSPDYNATTLLLNTLLISSRLSSTENYTTNLFSLENIKKRHQWQEKTEKKG